MFILFSFVGLSPSLQKRGVSIPSWQELVDPFGWMVRQAREGMREPSLRIDVARYEPRCPFKFPRWED
jgi:hypothetical protein